MSSKQTVLLALGTVAPAGPDANNCFGIQSSQETSEPNTSSLAACRGVPSAAAGGRKAWQHEPEVAAERS